MQRAVTPKTVTEKGSEEMPQHVMRRGNRLYYNRAWPLDVQGKLGSAPFRRSLHTDSLREAVRSLPDMDREFQRRVDEARLAIGRERNRPALTNANAESLVAQSFRESLSRSEEPKS